MAKPFFQMSKNLVVSGRA